MSVVSKRILVTGGAGFLGSHLCERLLEAGHDVLCIDNYFTGRRANVAHLLDNPRFEIMRHDVTFSLYVEVDEIYNLACPASPVHYQHDPVQTTKTSVHGAINMLGLAKRLRAKILQASTSEVYGDPQVHPQREGYWGHVNPIGYRSCYDEGKRCAETLFFDYHRQHNLRINAVAPGGIRTAGMEYYFNSVPGAREKTEGVHAMRRLGEPREVADAVVYLLSDRASFITGHVLNVDGGITINPHTL